MNIKKKAVEKLIEIGLVPSVWTKYEEPLKSVYEKFELYKHQILGKKFVFQVKEPLKYKSIEYPLLIDDSPLLVFVKRSCGGTYLFAVDKTDINNYIRVIKKINVKKRRVANETGKLKTKILKAHI